MFHSDFSGQNIRFRTFTTLCTLDVVLPAGVTTLTGTFASISIRHHKANELRSDE